MPDFKRDPNPPLLGQTQPAGKVVRNSDRHFLINDLVHSAADILLSTAGGEQGLPPALDPSGGREMAWQHDSYLSLLCGQEASVREFWADYFGKMAA